MKSRSLSTTILTTLIALISAVHGLGSAGTTAVTYSTATVCGIVAGEPTQRIQCHQNSKEIKIEPNVSFDSISGGRNFFCGLRSGGSTILCWNTAAEGGGGGGFRPKRIYYNESVPLTDPAVGDDHVCAVKVGSGEAVCWRGVAPDGSPFPSPSPEKAQNFRSVTSGLGFSCGILQTTYRVVCWGNTGDSIGEMIETRFADSPMSTLIAGESHACGITVAGKLLCGGKNDSGQTNAPANPSGSDLGFSGLALGSNFSCAINRSSGYVTCWGSKARTFTDQVTNISFESIVAGSDFACGLVTVNLSVICWGPRWGDSKNPTVEADLGTIVPGPCVQSSCGSCGTYPDSETLCNGSGRICKTCPIPLPLAAPLPPATSPARDLEKSRSKLYLPAIIVGSIGGLFGLCSIGYCLFMTQIEKKSTAGAGDPAPAGEAPASRPSSFMGSMRRQMSSSRSMIHAEKTQIFSLSDLAAAAGNFSPENRIGGGSFGVVYRGTLPDGREVAVKRGDPAGTRTRKWLEKQSAFESELALLSRVHHKHLVGLIGFCHEGDERLLVYEFMVNGSLHDHLHNDVVSTGGETVHSWRTRIKIALGAARGIEYLHSYAVPPIIHRDIKSSNILLDGKLTARVSDFGLSLMGPDPDKEHVPSQAVGTLGYIDPEYYVSRVLTTKSDVYGLGVVLLEMLTGKRAVFVEEDGGPVGVVEFAGPWIAAGQARRVLDERVGLPESELVEAGVRVLAMTALRCVEMEGRLRPSIGEVVASLERAVALCDGAGEPSFSTTVTSFSVVSSGSLA